MTRGVVTLTILNSPEVTGAALHPSRRLRNAMLVHIAMLPLYALWVWLGAFSQFWWAGALGLGFMWGVLAWFIRRWVSEGRERVEPRIVLWGLLAWFNLLLVLPLLWAPTRRFLVPPKP